MITRTGPARPCAAAAAGLLAAGRTRLRAARDRPVMPVRLLGEDLVLFRSRTARWALIGRFCAHRGVDLVLRPARGRRVALPLPRLALRPGGRCQEQPAEPEHSRFHAKVRSPSYPCEERNGIVFAYLGGGTRRRSRLRLLRRARRVHVRVQGPLGVQLAAGPGGRHRPEPRVVPAPVPRSEDPREAYGQQFREEVAGTGTDLSKLVGRVLPARHRGRADRIRAAGVRGAQLDRGDLRHVRITNLLFPNAFGCRSATRRSSPVARADRRREPLLVHDLLRLRGARPTRRRCSSNGSPGSRCRTTGRSQPRQQLGLRPGGAGRS